MHARKDFAHFSDVLNSEFPRISNAMNRYTFGLFYIECYI